jgi:hypothetical protein
MVFAGAAQALFASGHGPVFGLATPTNPKGGWSADLDLMGRIGSGTSGTMLRAALGYGLTPDLKLAVSAPVIFKTETLAPARVAPFTPMSGDFEATATWRFQRRNTGIGSRFETALIGGLLVPGPQEPAGRLAGLPGAPGFLAGIVTGYASRAHYAWAGGSFQRYWESDGFRRPDLAFYSLVYAYRPRSWRTDYPRWDWRLIGELTGERSGTIRRFGFREPSGTHQIFLGPSTLGVYKNYGIGAGVQFPVHRAASFYPRERYRFAVNLAYFF